MAKTAAPKGNTAAAERAYEAFRARMDKNYGAGKFSKPAITPYRVIPTGSLDLDSKLVIGGVPVGRITEIWGPEGAGKTLFSFWVAREALKMEMFADRRVGFIDMEHRFDARWAVLQGLDLDRVELVQPSDAEEVADMVKDMCRSGLFSVVIVDSVGSMISKKEIEKDAEDVTVGLQAKLVTRMVKIAAPAADDTDTTVLLINQVRANVGGFGSATTTGGGFALRHASTIKIRVSRGEAINVLVEGKQVPVGYKHLYKIERNSMAPHGRTSEVVIYNVATDKYGPVGLDRADEAATVGIRHNVILQRGGFYVFTSTGEQVRGRDAVIETLRANPELIDDVRNRVLASISNEVLPEERALDDEEGTEVEE